MRNYLLITNTVLSGVLFLLSACLIDSESMFPTVACAFSLAWICLFLYANKERIERMLDEQ